MTTKMRHMLSAVLTATVLLFFTLVPSTAAAEDWIQFDAIQFSISGDKPLDSLEDALDDLIKLSYAFRPDGAEISDLRVIKSGPKGVPRVVFRATRGVGFVKHTATVKADIYTQKQVRGCKRWPDSKAYKIKVHMGDSDNLVAANVSIFTVTLCVREHRETGKLHVVASGRMKKGHDYGRFAGPAITNLIEAQTDPLLTALKEVVDFYQHQ